MFPVRRARLAASLGLILCLSTGSAYAASVAHFWSKAFGGSTGNELPAAIVVDGIGDVIIAGTFAGTVNFGGGNLVSAGFDDIFLARYTATGVHLWSKRFGGTGSDGPRGLALGPGGEIYMTGSFVNTINFGGSNLPSLGLEDMFIARFTLNGTHAASFNYGGAGSDIGTSIAVDAIGNYVVTGIYTGTAFFGAGGSVTSAGGNDVFVVRYGYSTPNWVASYGSTNADYGNDVAYDVAGNVYLTGRFRNTVSFGGASLVSAGVDDVFLAKYDGSGAHQWSQRFGGTGSDYGTSVAVDGPGNIFMTGHFESAVNFGGGALTSAGMNDVFLARYTTGGAHAWSKRFGGTGADNGIGLALAPSNEVTITGWFDGNANFGGAPLVSAGSNDIYLGRYDANGAHLWSTRLGGTSFDFGVAVASEPSGDVLAAGGFYGAVNFGGATFTSAGVMDAYLARYGAGMAQPGVTSITDIDNDQGRRVTIAVRPSGYDDPDATVNVTQYEAYLRNDPPPALTASAGSTSALSREELLSMGWLFAGAVPAHAEDNYLIEAPTDADSTIAQGLHRSVFFVRAATDDPVVFYDSPPDSGYSVDNIAPPAPVSFVYGPPLAWQKSPATDFDYFSVYGSASPVFDAGAVLITQTIGNSASSGPTPYAYYYVTATDFSGNEGAAAKIQSSTGIGKTARYALAVNAYPNPFNPRTTLTYTVPSRGAVSLVVYDAQGARVATLVNGEREAGAHSIEWDGRTDGAAVAASGVYFVRLSMNGANTARKIALVK